MRLASLLAPLSVAVLVAGREEFSFNSKEPTKCFVVSHPNSNVFVQGLSFWPRVDLEDAGHISETAAIQLLAYRKKDIVSDYQFRGQHTDLVLCNEEAVELGYCLAQDSGKILYKAKEENYTPLLHGIFYVLKAHESGSVPRNFTAKEPGYYCLKTHAPTAKFYTVGVTIEDNKLRSSHDESLIMFKSCEVLAFVVASLFLVVSWYGLEKPLTIKWLILSQLLSVITSAWRAYAIYALTNTLELDFIESSKNLWLDLFVFFQLSKEFTHHRPTKLDSKKFFFLIQFVYLFDFAAAGLLIYSGGRRSLGYYISHKGAAAIRWTLKATRIVTQCYLYIRIFFRYLATSRAYKEFNKWNHPMLEQFRALFFYHFIVFQAGSWMLIFLIVLAHEKLLPLFAFHREYFMVDGEAQSDSIHGAFIITSAIVSLAQVYVLWRYWRPQNFREIDEYKERED